METIRRDRKRALRAGFLVRAALFALLVAAPGAPAQAAATSSPAAEPGARPLKLRELQALARQHDPRAGQALAQLENALGKRDEARWAFFPTFDTTLGAGGPTTEAKMIDPNGPPYGDNLTPGSIHGPGSYGLRMLLQSSATLPLWTFGKLTAGRQAAEAGARAREALLSRVRDQSAYDVARAYWGWQTAHAGLVSIDSVRAKVRDARKEVQTLVAEESDQVSKSDLVRLDYAAEEVEAQHAGTIKNEALALVGLKLLVGCSPEEELPVARESLPPAPVTPPLDALLSRAREKRPELRAAQENVRARAALVDLERGRLWPDFGLMGGFTWQQQTNASSPNSPFIPSVNVLDAWVGLGFRGTFDFPQKLARLHQVEADLHEAEALLSGAESLLRLELQQATGDLNEAREKADRFERESKIAKQLVVAGTLAFDSGLGEAHELVLDTGLFARAEGERLSAFYGAQLAWAALERAVGEEMAQEPPAPRADQPKSP
jgi:multidrug efflux system outer membrane protein